MHKFIVRILTRHLFKWVDKDDLFEVVNGRITYRGKPLEEERATELSERASTFVRSRLWKMLSNEIRYTAYLHWMQQGEDMSSRMLLRAEEIISKKLEELANVKKVERNL